MSKEVYRLKPTHDRLLLKFLTEQHKKGYHASREIGARLSYLDDPNGLVLGTVEGPRLEQVALVRFEETVQTKLYGTLSLALIDVLDMLCAHCSSRTPTATVHDLIVHAENIANLRAVYPLTRLGRYTVERSEHYLTAGKHPEDERLWALLKNRLPANDLVLFSTVVKYPE